MRVHQIDTTHCLVDGFFVNSPCEKIRQGRELSSTNKKDKNKTYSKTLAMSVKETCADVSLQISDPVIYVCDRRT